MVAGDFNAHIGCPDIKQRIELHQHSRAATYPANGQVLFVPRHPKQPDKGLKYTFFRDNTKSLIDLVLLSAADAFLVKKSEIMQHHPLNTLDHLPVKIEAKWSTERNDTSPPPQKVNWTKVIERRV